MFNYSEHKSNATDWELAEEIMGSPLCHTIFVWGPPGVGKTYTAMRSGLFGRKVYSVTLTPETPAAELRGFWMPKGNEFVWQDGVFIKAMREGARVIINEISHASHDVLAILYPVLESRETASLTLPSTETISPSEGFQVICTDNMPKEDLPEALRDRFRSTMFINRPHPDAVNRLDEDIKKLAIAMFDEADEDRRVSMRGWLAVQEMRSDFGLEQAFEVVFGKIRGARLHEAVVMAGA